MKLRNHKKTLFIILAVLGLGIVAVRKGWMKNPFKKAA